MSNPSSADRVCKCSMRTRLVGDGCEVCNPERAAELSQPETNPIFSTHADGCWSWGRKHYDCALRQIEALTRERDQYKLAAEMAQESIVELQKQRDTLDRSNRRLRTKLDRSLA